MNDVKETSSRAERTTKAKETERTLVHFDAGGVVAVHVACFLCVWFGVLCCVLFCVCVCLLFVDVLASIVTKFRKDVLPLNVCDLIYLGMIYVPHVVTIGGDLRMISVTLYDYLK